MSGPPANAADLFVVVNADESMPDEAIALLAALLIDLAKDLEGEEIQWRRTPKL